jgi:hypothetical protein
MSLARNPGITLLGKLLPYFPDQKRKIPGNHEMPEVFPATKSLISDITGFPNGDGGSLINFFNVIVASLFLS